MEEREFRSPSRNLGSPMARSVSGFSNVMTGAMAQNDEVYRLRKQVKLGFLNLTIATHKGSRLPEREGSLRTKNPAARVAS